MILTIKMDLSRFLLHLPLWLQIVLLVEHLRLLLRPLKVGKPQGSQRNILLIRNLGYLVQLLVFSFKSPLRRLSCTSS